MKNGLMLHDLNNILHQELVKKNEKYMVFPASPAVRPCLGCFSCWVKTPGECIITDRGQEFLSHMAEAGEIVVISKMCFGSYSPDIKAIIDRSIGYILPFFRIIQGQMHHVPRYDHKASLKCVFYGDEMSERDKSTARRLCKANALNFDCEQCETIFVESGQLALEVIK